MSEEVLQGEERVPSAGVGLYLEVQKRTQSIMAREQVSWVRKRPVERGDGGRRRHGNLPPLSWR